MSGATIGYDCTETWGNQHTRLNLNGDNAGFLVDIYPFGGKFSNSNKGHFVCQDPRWLTISDATDEQINAAMRREGRDFFRFAERLRIYPVLQLSIGLQF